MAGLAYLDFDVVVERNGGAYRTRVLRSPAGEATAPLGPVPSPDDLEQLLARLSAGTGERAALEAATRDFGAKLFTALFVEDVRDLLRASLDLAEGRDAGLRLRLRLAGAPSLADLPWEFLYQPPLHRFLVLSGRTPLVRYLELPEQIRPLTVKPPLRMLAMVSSPSDLPGLDVTQEWSKLDAALRGLQTAGLVQVERIERASLQALQHRLRAEQYHLLHFVGHGGFDDDAQDGVLLLEDEEGHSQAVSGRHLGTLLHDHRSLRLAVLNSCAGARTSKQDPFAGVAQSLVEQGIPAVIAMQFDITDRAAITFAQEFYAAMADGYPVDQALAETRKAILLSGNAWEWATPVLYMRAADGRIFDVAAGQAAHPVSKTEMRPESGVVSTPSPAPEQVTPEGTAAAHQEGGLGQDSAAGDTPHRADAPGTGPGGGRAPALPAAGDVQEMRDALARRRLVLFIGGDLPEDLTGLPARRRLAEELARRAGGSASQAPDAGAHGETPEGGSRRLASVAQEAMQSGFRHNFTDFLRTQLDFTGKPPGPFYETLAQLALKHSVETLITAAYDNLLESAFGRAGTGLNVVIRPSDVAFIDRDRPTLIKLFGDRNQPDTLIVTEQDQNALLRDWKNPILGEVQSALRRNGVLFLGYDLDDPVVSALFDEIAGDRFQIRSYAVWPGLPSARKDSLRTNRNLLVLEADPLALLRALV